MINVINLIKIYAIKLKIINKINYSYLVFTFFVILSLSSLYQVCINTNEMIQHDETIQDWTDLMIPTDETSETLPGAFFMLAF